MARYWSHDTCGWVESTPADPLSTPWSAHGLTLPAPTGAVSPADLIGGPQRAVPPLPQQRPAAAAPVDA